MDTTPIPILWSGGFDSTFRVLQLTEQGQTIQPVYLRMTDDWHKQQREQRAISQIAQMLPRRLRRRIKLRGMKNDAAIWNQYGQLRSVFREVEIAGWMQDRLIAAAGVIHPGIEASYVAGDELTQDDQRVLLLRTHGVQLPLLNQTKSQMVSEAGQHDGWLDLLALTWSCGADNADALTGPCGQCASCLNRVIPTTLLQRKGR